MPQPSHRAQAFQSNLHTTVGDMQNYLPSMGSVVQIRLSMFVGRHLLSAPYVPPESNLGYRLRMLGEVS